MLIFYNRAEIYLQVHDRLQIKLFGYILKELRSNSHTQNCLVSSMQLMQLPVGCDWLDTYSVDLGKQCRSR